MTYEYRADERESGQVKLLIAMGIPVYDVAKVFGCSEGTLRKYFAKEIETGQIEANAKVANSLFRQATGERPNITACIFWLKCRAGWVEPVAAPGEQPGKKELANQVAKTAEQGTSWEGLLQ